MVAVIHERHDMGKYIDESQYTILDEIIERHNEEHEKNPRIDCLRHGRTLICAGCKKCLNYRRRIQTHMM